MKQLLVPAVSLTLLAGLAACNRAPDAEPKPAPPPLTSGVIQGLSLIHI